MKASATKKKMWLDPKRLAKVTPQEILLLLQEAVQTRVLFEASQFALEKVLGEWIRNDGELEIFDLGQKDEVTLEDAARFLDIVRRESGGKA